ncbi:MAG: NifU family protein [Candidatus Aerophobetes bacterium]|nr:NifU family protein [Candidatus Aerophobetes bacterium]
MQEKVEKVINKKIRPILIRDGGNIEVVEAGEDGVVKVRLIGACAGCPMAELTLLNVVTKAIKSSLPEVKKVEAL